MKKVSKWNSAEGEERRRKSGRGQFIKTAEGGELDIPRSRGYARVGDTQIVKGEHPDRIDVVTVVDL